MKAKFVYIVLHYIALEATIECVESIKKINEDDSYRIVIVDNSSPNRSGEQLSKLYQSHKDVVVLLNEANEGFARGNNRGIGYANREFKPNFICILNNDVVIGQTNFQRLVENEYESSHFAVLGPLIKHPDGSVDQYPQQPMSRHQLIKQLVINTVKLAALYSGIYTIYLRLKRAAYIPKQIITKSKDAKYKLDVVVHGSCLVFSKKYFEKYAGFDERTFMYKEEQLLYWRLKRSRLKSVYYPSIQVLHKKELATKQSISSERKRLIFFLKNQLKSGFILLGELKKND